MAQDLVDEVVGVAAALTQRGQTLAFAESCTGGLLAKLATDLPGSSRWFERGLVTYSNVAKTELLGVPPSIFESDGAVSEACVRAMSEGLMQHSPADWGASVSGIAGPDGGSPGRPVGTVWMSWIRRGGAAQCEMQVFGGDRDQVRQQTAIWIYSRLRELLSSPGGGLSEGS